MFELVGRPWESEDQRDWDPGAVGGHGDTVTWETEGEAVSEAPEVVRSLNEVGLYYEYGIRDQDTGRIVDSGLGDYDPTEEEEEEEEPCGSSADCLHAVHYDGWCVEDDHGGVWWPGPEAEAVILSAADPGAEAVRQAFSRLADGEWHS